MTTLTEPTTDIEQAVISCEEAVELIDTKLAEFAPRSIVSKNEMCDLLLDIRNHIAYLPKN